MSIYATTLTIEDERHRAAEFEAAGVKYGIIDDAGEVEDLNDLPPEMLDAPIVYEGSHILPSDDDRRGGSVDLAIIPDHVTRHDARPEGQEGAVKPWVRLTVASVDSDSEYGGKPYVPGGTATVVLTRDQVRRLRDDLTRTLEHWEGA